MTTFRTVRFASGETRQVPALMNYPVLGLDADDRVVVQMGSAQAPPVYTISLTSCCATFERSVGADAMVCRECRNPVPADVYDRPVVDPYAADGPEPLAADPLDPDAERVWVWFAARDGLPDEVLMVFIHDVEAGGMPALRMLMATDEETAIAFGEHARAAADHLGVTAVCKQFIIERVRDSYAPTSKEQ